MNKTHGKYRTTGICISLVVLTLAVFWQVKNCEFIEFDDSMYVYDNPHVNEGLKADNIIWAFTAFHSSNWHPLTWISHMVDCEFFGLEAGRHHMVNLLWHSINVVLLFALLKAMTGAVWPAGFAAALFAVHPMHVESVAWVAERKDVLSTFFWLLTMAAYMQYARRPGSLRYSIVLIVFVLGLMAKPMLVTLPFVLLLLDYWPLGRFEAVKLSRRGGQKKKRPAQARSDVGTWVFLIREKFPFFVLSAVSCVVTFFAQRSFGSVVDIGGIALPYRIANSIVSYGRYIYKLFWPMKLAVLYPHPLGDVVLRQVFLALLLLGVITILVFRFGRRYRFLTVGWFWYLLTLVPVIGLLQVGVQAMADRYTYVPYIGLFIMIAWGANNLPANWRFRKIGPAVTSIVIVSVLSVCSYRQLIYWHDTGRLFERTLAVTEKNFLAHNVLGDYLLGQGRIEESIAQNSKALEFNPNFMYSYVSLGTAFAKQGKEKRAIGCYLKAIEIEPDAFYAHNSLGKLLFLQGDYAGAACYLREALRIKPEDLELLRNLADAYVKSGKFTEAISGYQKLIEINPGDLAVKNNMGYAYLQMNQTDKAAQHYRESLEIDPNDVAAYHGIGNCLMKKGKLKESIWYLQQALKMRDDFFKAYFDLGVVYVRLGDNDEAIKYFSEAVRVNPDSEKAQRALFLLLDNNQ
ncbi:MAG: tetratricopeptide repeat protein [Planctomycetota bacterium]|jgi:tetratricopeptide (TPR) repeat protein